MRKPTPGELLDFAGAEQGRIASFLTHIMAVPSTYGEEAKVQGMILRAFRRVGFEVDEVPISESIRLDEEYTHTDSPVSYEGRANLCIRLGGGDEGRSAILNTHSDVVPAGSWEGAFAPRVEDGTLIGRGAADCKGQIGSLLLLALMLREFDVELKGALEGQVVIEEEIGGNGSLSLIREGHRADGVVVLEGTDLTVCPANRGAVWFKATVEGKPVHMARKHEGVSAVDLSIELIDLLYRYEEQLATESQGQRLFSEYEHPVQVNIGMISAGDWPSTVPGRAVLEGGVGFLPNRDIDSIRRDLTSLPGKGSRALSSRVSFEFCRLHNDAYCIPGNHPLVRTLMGSAERAGISTRKRGMISSCDARLFNKVGGMPTVVFGAGEIDQAHSRGERIRLVEISREACALFQFAKEWCGN